MLKPVVLVNEFLSDEEIASIVVQSSTDRRVTIFDSKDSSKLIVLPDFGTFFVGFETSNEIEAHDLFPFIHSEEDAAWIVPPAWKLQHVVKRLGMFPSTGQAMKNGWNGDIPNGFSQFVARINKVKGVLTFYKNVSA